MGACIDSHHHFWRYTPEEFGWLGDGMEHLRRDFLPEDLQTELRAAGVDGVISVQARQSLEESRFLLEMAAQHDFIRGVVGWVPLTSERVGDDLAALAHSKLRAVRHVLQGEADEFHMLREDFGRGIRELRKFDLVYDILIYEHQLPQTITFVDRHPHQPFVLDHVAKPQVRNGALEPWEKNIRRLAERDHVSCKLSGLVTEADFSSWAEEQLQPYFDVVFDAFGPDRLLFGSDWPVCLAACSYRRWHGLVRQQIAALSAHEQDAVMGGNATRVYSLPG